MFHVKCLIRISTDIIHKENFLPGSSEIKSTSINLIWIPGCALVYKVSYWLYKKDNILDMMYINVKFISYTQHSLEVWSRIYFSSWEWKNYIYIFIYTISNNIFLLSQHLLLFMILKYNIVRYLLTSKAKLRGQNMEFNKKKFVKGRCIFSLNTQRLIYLFGKMPKDMVRYFQFSCQIVKLHLARSYGQTKIVNILLFNLLPG